MCRLPNGLLLQNIRWFIVDIALWFTVRYSTIGTFHIMDALKPEPEKPSGARSALSFRRGGFPFEFWILSFGIRGDASPGCPFFLLLFLWTAKKRREEALDVEAEGDHVSSLLYTSVSVTPSMRDSGHHRNECEN